MIEMVEDESFEEPLELEGTEDEFSKCGKSKIKYTRALLLQFDEVEACRKLPRDFELLILPQLDGDSDGTTAQKSIFCNSSGLGPLLWTRWNLDLPGERWDSHLLTPSKDSHLQRNCDSESRKHEQLPQEFAYDDWLLGQKPQTSVFFQLSKSENPYRPPPCKKKMLTHLGSISDHGMESSVESGQNGSDKPWYEVPLVADDDSTKKPFGESEDSWADDNENEVFSASETLVEIIEEILEDNQLMFDDFWEEILETIHPQLEPSISPTNSELEICLPTEDSLVSVDHSTPPENSEDDIILPDEDSLISIYDMIVLDSDSLGPNKAMPNTIVNIRKNSESQTVTRRGDLSTRISRKAPSVSHFPGLVTYTKLHSSLSQSQVSTDMFDQKTSFLVRSCHTNSSPMFMIPIIAPSIPSLNCFNQSDIHHRSHQENTHPNTNTNDSFFQYSVLNQPNIFAQQQNHLPVGTSCLDPSKQVASPDFSTMQISPLTPQHANYNSFGQSNAVALDPVGIGGYGEEASSGFSLWRVRY